MEQDRRPDFQKMSERAAAHAEQLQQSSLSPLEEAMVREIGHRWAQCAESSGLLKELGVMVAQFGYGLMDAQKRIRELEDAAKTDAVVTDIQKKRQA